MGCSYKYFIRYEKQSDHKTLITYKDIYAYLQMVESQSAPKQHHSFVCHAIDYAARYDQQFSNQR